MNYHNILIISVLKYISQKNKDIVYNNPRESE